MILRVNGEFCARFMKSKLAGLPYNDTVFGLGACFDQRDTEAEVEGLDNW